VNRSCALKNHSFRHTAACPLLCPGSCRWGFCSARADSQGGTPGSCLALYFASTPSVNERSTLASPFCVWSAGLALSCALLVVVLAARLDVAWLLVLGVRAYATPGPRKSWTTPLETVPIDRSPFWLVVLGIRTRRSGTSQVETVWLSWTTPLETIPIDRSSFWLVVLVILQA